MRERAVRRRMEGALLRQEAGGQIADQMLERGQQMLAWPIEEVKDVTKSTITPDGHTITQITRIIKPLKWDLNALARFIEAMDKIARSSVIDATKKQQAEGIPAAEIAERHFILYTAEQVQMPVVPEQSATEAPKDSDWSADYGQDSVHEPSEQTVW